MRVLISKVGYAADSVMVHFVSEYGIGRARWMGLPPNEGCEYLVELDCDDPLEVGVNCAVVSDIQPRLVFINSKTSLVVVIEEICDDETASLRLGNSVFMVEYEGEFPQAGSWIQVFPVSLQVSDMNM